MMPIEKYKLLDILKSVNHQGISIAICRRIGNLKNTQVSTHWRVPWQPYIGALMYGQSSYVWLESIHRRMFYTSEVWTHTSEDGPYIGAPMFKHAFRCMAMFIRSLNYHSVFHSTWSRKNLNRLSHTFTHLHFSRAFYQVIILNLKNQALLKFNLLNCSWNWSESVF